MKSGGGKSKGSNFERDICKKLTVWVTGQEKPYIFWRSPSSGAVATVSQSSNISGDIIAVKTEGNFFTDIFSIECKDGYKEVDLFKHFKLNKNDTFVDFWNQCIKDARLSNKFGMLIYKKTGYPIVICIESSIIKILVKQKVVLPKSISINFDDLPDMTIYNFELFLKNVSPTNIRKLNKKNGHNL